MRNDLTYTHHSVITTVGLGDHTSSQIDIKVKKQISFLCDELIIYSVDFHIHHIALLAVFTMLCINIPYTYLSYN